MFGFIKKRLARPQEAPNTGKMTNLEREEDLVLANSPDEKPKYSYHNSFELPGAASVVLWTRVMKEDRR